MASVNEVEALAVVEVDPDRRVCCQAADCGKSIWKAVHVVRIEGNLQIVGSTCFKKLYGDVVPAGIGKYTGNESRKLSELERQQLLENTEAFVRMLELRFAQASAEAHQAEQARREAETAALNVNQTQECLQAPSLTNGRFVTCYYCKQTMMTHLSYTPGLGHKCDSCKLNNVPLPPRESRYHRK